MVSFLHVSLHFFCIHFCDMRVRGDEREMEKLTFGSGQLDM